MGGPCSCLGCDDHKKSHDCDMLLNVAIVDEFAVREEQRYGLTGTVFQEAPAWRFW
jgi:hypothetical protein